MSAISIEPTQPSSPVSPPDHKLPDYKDLKSGQKQKKDSVRRRLGSSLDAAFSPPSSPVVHNGSFDSLDLALQVIDELKETAATRSTASTNFNSNPPDPESQYNNESPITTQEVSDKNATPSPGPGSSS
jgi:hypothetical protein